MARILFPNIDMKIAESKKDILLSNLQKLGSIIVAFSGGVDSTFLLAVASLIPGLRLAAATASSILHPNQEKQFATDFAEKNGICHIVFQTDELGLPEFVINGDERCYHCKQNMFRKLFDIAKENNFKHIAHGANTDDQKDYRPGFRAADEEGVIAPLIDARLNKEEIRFLSKKMGLPTWDRPAMACFATRIPYGSPVTANKIMMIEEAEEFLRQKGFKEVRVRHYGPMAVIEVNGPVEMERIIKRDVKNAIIHKFREIGFEFFSMDIEGLISGKMNRTLTLNSAQPEPK